MKIRMMASSLALALATSACATFEGSPMSFKRGYWQGQDIAMTADYRMVMKRQRGNEQVVCAEPSPDMARIVSQAFNASATGSAKGIAKVQPELALALAASRAESLAQLGSRLATIQLLRDSTYRACEAYANNAISQATYAMIVSRYDDVMVTLLLGEMAAGGAAARAASVSGSATTAGLSPASGAALVDLGVQRVAAAQEALKAARQAEEGQQDDALTAAKEKTAAAESELAAARTSLDKFAQAVGSTGATSISLPGEASPERKAAAEIAATLGAMQASYLRDFNLDPIVVGCLSALSLVDDGAPRDFGLQQECRAVLANGTTLQQVAKAMLEQNGKHDDAAVEPRPAGLRHASREKP